MNKAVACTVQEQAGQRAPSRPCEGRLQKFFSGFKEANQFTRLLEAVRAGNAEESQTARQVVSESLREKNPEALKEKIRELANTRDALAWEFMKEAAGRGGFCRHVVLWQSTKVMNASNSEEIFAFQKEQLKHEQPEVRQKFLEHLQSLSVPTPAAQGAQPANATPQAPQAHAPQEQTQARQAQPFSEQNFMIPSPLTPQEKQSSEQAKASSAFLSQFEASETRAQENGFQATPEARHELAPEFRKARIPENDAHDAFPGAGAQTPAQAKNQAFTASRLREAAADRAGWKKPDKQHATNHSKAKRRKAAIKAPENPPTPKLLLKEKTLKQPKASAGFAPNNALTPAAPKMLRKSRKHDPRLGKPGKDSLMESTRKQGKTMLKDQLAERPTPLKKQAGKTHFGTASLEKTSPMKPATPPEAKKRIRRELRKERKRIKKAVESERKRVKLLAKQIKKKAKARARKKALQKKKPLGFFSKNPRKRLRRLMPKTRLP